MSSRRVLVVGGGLAGIAAATTLRAAGHEVRVIEREAEPGGRARGDAQDGFRLDSAPFVVSARDARLLALVERAGLADGMLPLRPLRFAQTRGGRIEAAAAAGGVLDVARVRGVRLHHAFRLARLSRLERRFGDALDPERPERAADLDYRSASDFVRLYFGASVWRHWAAPLLAADWLADPAEVSRCAFLLQRAARGEAPLGSLRGSPAAIAEALWTEADLPGAEVVNVTAGGGRPIVHLADGARLEADAIVLALPAAATLRVAEGLLTPAERDALGAATTVPAIVWSLGVGASPVPKATRVRVLADAGLPLASLTVEPGGSGSAAPPGGTLVQVVANPAWSARHLDVPDAVVEKDLALALDRVFPGTCGGARTLRLRRHREALPRFDVGRYRALARLRRVQDDRRARGRRLYFAGDHWIAPSLEGAIASGMRAAVDLLDDLGRGSGSVPG